MTSSAIEEKLDTLLSEVAYLKRNLVDERDYEQLSLRSARKEAKCSMLTIQAAVESGELASLPGRMTNLGFPQRMILRGDLRRWNNKRLSKALNNTAAAPHG